MKNIWNSGFYRHRTILIGWAILESSASPSSHGPIIVTLSALSLCTHGSPGPLCPKPEKKERKGKKKKDTLLFPVCSSWCSVLFSSFYRSFFCTHSFVHSFSAYVGASHVPSIMLALLSWYRICHNNLWGGCCYPWFINEQTEAQRSWVISPGIPSP